MVVDVSNLKNGRKPVKLQKESPAGCAGEGKQSKGNNLKNGKESSEVTEGKSSRMRWGR